MKGRRKWIWILAIGLGATPPSLADQVAVQEEQPERPRTQGLPLRVTLVRPGGRVVVDRGSRDGVVIGDRVVFHPRGRKSAPGIVRSLDERSAEVQLDDPRVTFQQGTIGIVHVSVRENEPALEPPPVAPTAPEHAPWENVDDEYEPGMPLLIEMDGVRPETRTPLLSGRVYSIGDVRETSDDARSDSFFRLGTELLYENPFGNGGELTFEGEANYRSTEVFQQVNESTTQARLDRLSYSWGGTRFKHQRHELGRFLQRGVPEFGILDGYEWNQRLDSGHRMGTSVGFLPEPTPSMSSFEDFAVSGFYHWTADKRERLTATGAYQKTWHNGAADRDLMIGKLDFWPAEGWDLHTTAWVDYYTGGDDAKKTTLELTRLIASTGKRWNDGDGLNFTFLKQSFPQLDRYEFLPVLQSELSEAHNERLATDGWTWLGRDRRLHGQVGLWVDQEDSGADAEVGLEHLGVFSEEGSLDVRLFGVDGKFSTTYGGRLDYGIQMMQRRWNLSYEYSLNDQVGFTDNNDDLDQHRLVGSVDHTSSSGWSLSLQGGLTLWSSETAVTAGFYLQKGF